MELIYSGFDTIVFAVKGALNPIALKHLDLVKKLAVKEQRDVLINFEDSKLKGLIAPTGAKGGFAYILKLGGDLGHVVSLKTSLNRNEWNAHVKIRALALACYGWEDALARVFNDLSKIGFSRHGISLNRIDYAMDYLNAGIELKPELFVAHSRVKKAAHKLETNAYARGPTWESVTIGKMPNRQIIIYDKRREAIDKRKPEWFTIWRLDPDDITQTVHRVEVRLGKEELRKTETRTLDAFKSNVNAALSRAVHVVRYVEPLIGQNISRSPNQPLWHHVQHHVREHVLKNPHYVEPARVKHVIRSQKALESKKQILGNMANLSVFEDMSPDHMKEQMVKFVQDEFSIIQANDEHPFWKSRGKTQDRFLFLESKGVYPSLTQIT